MRRNPIAPIVVLSMCLLVVNRAAAQARRPAPPAQSAAPVQVAPWSEPLRGSWVQAGAAGAADVVLASGNSGAEIVVGADEPLNVHQAAVFLAGDIERISGYRPPIVATPTAERAGIRLQTLGHGQLPASLDVRGMQGQWEAYRVITAPRTVWLIGSNPRGTAFAAYTLSERLGIDPLYLWTGYVPEHHDPLVLKATRFVQGTPTFKYRGFFHDDEDVLPRPFDERGYPLQTGDVPLDWYKRFFETALRLRMNMVAPYVRVHRRFEVQQLGSDWGLIFTSHHYDILVSNPFGLVRFNLAQERGVRPVYDWFTNREGMLRFWRGGVDENHNIDVIWPVGMRNTEDRGYIWPQGTTDDDKARVFHEVITDQVNMVHEALPPGRTPVFHFTMYTEMLPLFQRNPAAFDLPADVIIIWPDDNNGFMRGLPTELGKWKHGVYYHLAYLGGNLSKQVVNIVAPSTIATEFDKIVRAGATEYMLVNMSETREYVMGARMIADITWNAPGALGTPDAPNRFVSWWTHEYFGAGADAAQAVYNQYYQLLDTPDKMWQASNAAQGFIDRLYDRVLGDSVPPPVNADTVAMLQSRSSLFDQALAAVDRAEALLTPAQRQYFHENAALGLIVAARQTQSALHLAEAVQAPDAAQMWHHVNAARGPLDQLEMEFLWAEHPPFDRWYGETWIRSRYASNNPHRPYDDLRQFIGNRGRDRPVRPRFGPPPPAAPPPRPGE
jgi:hypothetical protein